MRRRLPSIGAALTGAALVVAALSGGLLARAHLDGRASFLDRIEAPLVDLRFAIAGTRQPPSDLLIVAIDDTMVREAGAYPLPRATMAKLVRSLTAQKPLAVALDILFLDPGAPEPDRSLAAALATGRTVIAAAALFDRSGRSAGTELRQGPLPDATEILWPLEALREAAAVGVVNIATDHAGTPRHVPMLVRLDGSLTPSFALRAVTVASGTDAELNDDGVVVGGRPIALDIGYHLPLRFYGPRGTITTVGAAEVLAGTVPAEAVRDHIVVIGATAVGTGDTFATPFDSVLPGVEVLTTAIGNLQEGGGLVRTRSTRHLDAAAAIALPIVTVLLVATRRIGFGLAIAAMLVGVWIAVAVIAFLSGLWLAIALPVAAVMPASVLYVVGRLWLDRRVERRLEATQAAFRRFHPPALADELAARPDFLAEPRGQDAAVLFVDLSGFTGLAERLGPERTREYLKHLHSVIDAEVTRHAGLVVSFMGDGAMIVFGLPESRPDDADRAACCAVALADRIAAWTATFAETGQALGARVGGHFGHVVVSRLGGEQNQHITATGDCVNVASRLLEVAAANRAAAALSSDLLDAAGPACAAARLFGERREIAIRGRAQPLSVRFRAREEASRLIDQGAGRKAG